MFKKLHPNTCRQCKRKVGKADSISCSCCSVWNHLKCSGLGKTEFENHFLAFGLNTKRYGLNMERYGVMQENTGQKKLRIWALFTQY